MRRHLRLLPITMLVACAVLATKLGGLWTGFAGSASALAAEEPGAAGAPPKTLPAAAEAKPPEAAAQTRIPPPLAESIPFTQAELDLLLKLSERRGQLAAREVELDTREAVLQAAELRLDEKVRELQALRDKVEGLLKSLDEQEETRIRSLVKIYETMKPKDAARIFDQLETDVLLEVMRNMKEAKTAPILASMDPVRAREMTTLLAQRKSLQTPGS